MKTLCTIIFTVLVALTGYTQPLGWNHSQVIAVTENSGANLYDYQLRMHFDSQSLIAAGEMNSDCSDLRFGNLCDAANLNYWIESGINSDSTVVWVKLDSILANDTRNIFLFYGNPLATSNSLATGTFFGPHSATDSVASGGSGGATNSQRGFRFTPNTDLLVTSFGKREPNGTTRFVTLFDFVTQAIIAQTQVSGPAAQYSYSNLASPIWLIGGTQYVLELYQGASDGYYLGTSSQIGQHITYGDMRYCNSCTQNTFPTNTLTNYHYGYPDLWYYTRNVVTPAPTYSIGGSFSVDLGPDSAFCVSTMLDAGNVGSNYLWSTAASSQTINVNASGSYAVLVTSPQNCVATDTVNVVINPNPVVNLGPDTAYCTGAALDAGSGYTYLWTDNSTNQTLNVALTGNYGVQITDANSCTDADTVVITIYGLPAVVATVSPDTVACSGDTLDFIGIGANAYTWNNGIVQGSNAITSGGNFIVTGIDLNGCQNTDTVGITVNPLPNVTFSFAIDSVCLNYSPITLSGGSPVGGTYSGTGVSAGDFDPAAGMGNYTLTYTYTDVNGCVNNDTENLLVSPCLGIDDLIFGSVAIFPNPTTGLVNVHIEKNTDDMVLNVYDMLGKNVHSMKLQNIQSMISLNVIPGMYILEMSDGNHFIRKQIIVQ